MKKLLGILKKIRHGVFNTAILLYTMIRIPARTRPC